MRGLRAVRALMIGQQNAILSKLEPPRPSVAEAFQRSVGEWLSLVEHLVRDQGVGGSNPLSPTISNQVLADTRRVGEKQGLPKKDLHWRKRFRCGHEFPPYSSGSHAHGFNSLFPPRLVVDILGHVDCGMSHVVPRYLWPDANTAHQA